MTEEHPLVRLARATIETYVREGTTVSPPKQLTEKMSAKAGAFVSLHKRGQLRGCIGTVEPVHANLAEEVIANAISAATRDPRFPAVRADELDDLEISIDVLTKPEPISSFDELDPKVYGVIVEHGRSRGLLLPDLEGVDTVERQVDIALRKAWLSPDDPYRMLRFRVIRYH